MGKNRFFVISGVLLLIGLFSLFFFRDRILNINSPKSLRKLLQLWPPRGFYDCFKHEFGTLEEGRGARFLFTNKYAGKHIIYLSFNNFTSEKYAQLRPSNKQPHIKVEMIFYLGDQIILSKIVGNDISPILNKQGGGIILDWYDSPETLPLNKEFTCTMHVLEIDKEFFNGWGSSQVYICKISDL